MNIKRPFFGTHTRRSPWTTGTESCSHYWSQSTCPFASLKSENNKKQKHNKFKYYGHMPKFCRDTHYILFFLGQTLLRPRHAKVTKRYSPPINKTPNIILPCMLTSHSLEYLMTMFLHCLLYSAMPILATSSGPLIPNVLSISYSYKNTQDIRHINKPKINL